MHISEGYLSATVLVSGSALAAVGTAIGLKKLDYDRIADAGMLTAVFFVASLVHVPIGPASAHLIMNGIIGLLLGWAAFPHHHGDQAKSRAEPKNALECNFSGGYAKAIINVGASPAI